MSCLTTSLLDRRVEKPLNTALGSQDWPVSDPIEEVDARNFIVKKHVGWIAAVWTHSGSLMILVRTPSGLLFETGARRVILS